MSNYNINDCNGLGIPGLGSSFNQAGCKPLISFLESLTIDVTGDGSTCNPLGLEVKDSAKSPISADATHYTIYSNDLLGGAGSAAAQNVASKSQSIIFGYRAGNDATLITTSILVGLFAGYQSETVANSVIIGYNAGSNSLDLQNTTAIGLGAGSDISENIYGSIFIGTTAGSGISSFNTGMLIAIGESAGGEMTATSEGNYASVLIGYNAGYEANDLFSGVAIGQGAGRNVNTGHNLVAIGENAAASSSSYNMIAIGEGAGAGDNVADASYDDYSIVIGQSAKTGGFKNSILLGGSIDGNDISNTASNQFMLAPNITHARWRSVDYEFPESQAAEAAILANDGAGKLDWQSGYAMPLLNQYYIPFTGADGKLTDTVKNEEAGALVWSDGVQVVSNNSFPFIGVKNSTSYNGIFRAVTTASGSSAKATIEFAKSSVPQYYAGLDNTSFVIRDAVNSINRLALNQTGNVELNGDGDLVINRTTAGVLKGLRFNEGGGLERAFVKLNGQTGEFRIGGGSNNYFPTFYSNGSERARIDTSGNFLLGTTTATGKLTIVGTGNTGSTANIDVVNSAGTNVFRVRDDGILLLGNNALNSQLIINSTNANAGVYSPAYSSGSANIINYKNFSGVSRMTLDMTGSLGLLGINTTAPTHPLTLSSTSMVGGNGIAFYSTTDQVSNYQRLRIALTSGNVANYNLESAGSGTAVGYHSFNLNGTAVLQVDAAQALFGGNLLLTASAGDNTKDIGRRNANPLRFRSMYLGTSAQIGLPADTVIGARMHLGAGTTALPQILLEDGVAPTSPVDGSIWREGNKLRVQLGGVTKEIAFV